jgi:hypothetical protein
MRMNQERLATAVVERIQRAATVDPLAWVPAIGLKQADGTTIGLAVEIFGEQPTRKELDALRSVLFRLGTSGTVEVREFKPNRKTGKLGPVHGTEQAVYGLAGPGSQILRPASARQYGVRLTVD